MFCHLMYDRTKELHIIMKELITKFITVLGTISFILFPQTVITAEPATTEGGASSTGSAAGSNAGAAAVGGLPPPPR